MREAVEDADAERQSLRCEGCGAALQLAAGLRAARCPYCAAPVVVERARATRHASPTFVLGFVVTEAAARAAARKWIASTWFTPRAFRRADVGETRGIYVPAYLYSAEAHVEYRAEIGEHYTVTETYTDSKGKTQTRTRTKTEWRSLQGRWSAFVDDLVVTASQGLPNDELEAVEPFDLRALRRYTPKVISGWLAEDPSLDEPHCRKLAHQEAQESIGRRLHEHMPGDSHRGLEYETRLHNEDLELLLLPVWVLAVRYAPERPAVRMVLNGQSGRIHGRPPRSWVMIVGTVVGVLVLGVLAYLGLGGVR
jgi:DNA-directed RNA polymerase subunit RPC12/RpoP